MDKIVYPRRNLPDPATQWGRTVEDQQQELVAEVNRLDSFVRGQNRSTASSLASLSRQINALPLTNVQGSEASGFAVSGSFNSVVSLAVPGVEGRQASIFITAEAGVEMTDAPNVADVYMRMVVDSSALEPGFMPFAGYGLAPGGGNRALGTSSHTLTTGAGQGATIELQVRSTNIVMTPARAANYATLNVMVTYGGLQ